MTLRRWMILGITLMVLALPPTFLDQMVGHPASKVIGLVLLVAGLAVWLLVIRCPECGAHLSCFPGEYCKYCGNKLDWDKRPRF